MKIRIETPVDVTTFAAFAKAVTSAHPLWKGTRMMQVGSDFVVELPTLPLEWDEEND